MLAAGLTGTETLCLRAGRVMNFSDLYLYCLHFSRRSSVISRLFNPAENTNSCLSFVQPLNASRTRLDRNQGVGELVFLSVREGITDNLMFHVRLPEKICL